MWRGARTKWARAELCGGSGKSHAQQVRHMSARNRCAKGAPRENKRSTMNTKVKRRLIAVTGIIVIVLIIVLAVVGAGGAARATTVEEAASGNFGGQKVQVSGNVVENSYEFSNNVLTFSIYDKDSGSNTQLRVRSEGSVSSTFGNDVTAICTGKIDDAGVLQTTEPIVTKCPSKYESGTSALSVEQLAGYGEEVQGKTVKVAGMVQGEVNSATANMRFALVDSAQGTQVLYVKYNGALPDEVRAGVAVVVTGSLDETGAFLATDVSLAG